MPNRTQRNQNRANAKDLRRYVLDQRVCKAARKAAGLTQDQAAYELGVTRNTWHQWEHGKRPMRKAYFDLFLIYTKEQAK